MQGGRLVEGTHAEEGLQEPYLDDVIFEKTLAEER